MLTKSAKIDGYLLIALAFFLFMVGTHLRQPLSAHHKILVASPSLKDPVFKHAVIFVFNHNTLGAAGIIVNSSAKSPVEPEKTFALHSPDKPLPGSLMMKDVSLGLITDAAFVEGLKSAEVKPKWYLITHGYAGWKPRQLDREIRRQYWKVIDFDPALLMETSPEKMWEEANKHPSVL